MADTKLVSTYLSMLEAGRKSGKGTERLTSNPRNIPALKEATRQQGTIVEKEAEERKKNKGAVGKSIQDAAFDSILESQSKLRGGKGVYGDKR